MAYDLYKTHNEIKIINYYEENNKEFNLHEYINKLLSLNSILVLNRKLKDLDAVADRIFR